MADNLKGNITKIKIKDEQSIESIYGIGSGNFKEIILDKDMWAREMKFEIEGLFMADTCVVGLNIQEGDQNIEDTYRIFSHITHVVMKPNAEDEQRADLYFYVSEIPAPEIADGTLRPINILVKW